MNSDLGFELIDASNSAAPSFFWRFGDPSSGSNNTLTAFAGGSGNAQHRFSAPGSYQVCVLFQEPGLPLDSLCIDIEVGLCCAFALELEAACFENAVAPMLTGNSNIDSVRWDFGAIGAAGNLQTSFAPLFQYPETVNCLVQALVYSACVIDTFLEPIELRACNEQCNIFAPNAITPNGDDLNDGFLPSTACHFVS